MNRKDSWTAALFLAALSVGVCVFLYGLLPKHLPGDMTRPAPLSARHMSARTPRAVFHTAAPQPVAQKPLLTRVNALLAGAEPSINRVLDNQRWFIQLYGGAQRAAGRTVVEDVADPQYTVVRLQSGALSFVSDVMADAETHAQHLGRLNRALASRGIPLLYLQAPGKLAPGSDALPYGVEDTANASADALLARLAELEVEAMDFRKTLAQSDRPWEDWFYRTDHHWTPDAAFYCYQALCDRIEQYNKVEKTPNGTRTTHYTVPARYRDSAQFTRETLENFFLGSQGKRVGSLYAPADDFVLWKPRFSTWFEHTVPIQATLREGRFEDSLLFAERIAEKDWFDGNPYTYYSGGDFAISYMKNKLDPSGPRVMLLRDSYACVLAPFLALPCSELILIDLRYFKDDLMRYIDWLKPDLVFVMYTTGTVRLSGMFDFFAKPADTTPFPQSKLLPDAALPAPALKRAPVENRARWQKAGAIG